MVSWPRAACLGEDPELFFPEGNTGRALLQLVPIALPGRPFRAENRAVVARRCRSSLVR
jgi:hypothetical protein